jgi:hypothetical protein
MGFSRPSGLAALSFLAVLFWIYLRERRVRTIQVPSLLLWTSVRDDSERRRFLPEAEFLLQALLLAALAFGLARPYLRISGVAGVERVVLVFDTSASLQALEGGERRFDRLRRSAQRLLDRYGDGVEWTVVAVDVRPRVILASTRNAGAVARALESLEPSDAPTRLALGLELVRSIASGAPAEVFLFTDLPREALASALPPGQRIHHVRVGRTDDNVAIVALRMHQSPFQDPPDARAYARVQNYAHRPKEVVLVATLEGHELRREAFVLPPREGRTVALGGFPGPGRLEVRIEASDALSADDRALAFVHPARRVRLLVVSRSPELVTDLRSVAEAVGTLDLVAVRPEEAGEEAYSRAEVALFHDWLPERPFPGSALWVFPPAGTGLLEVEGEAIDAEILDWNERDPLLEGVRYLEAMPLERSRRIRLPRWSRPLVETRAASQEFPLAFAGEFEGRRVVVFAFDLPAGSLRRSENTGLLVLLLNALRWLVPRDASEPVSVAVGDRYREALDSPGPVVVAAPDGSRIRTEPRAEIAIEIDRRGVYEAVFDGRRRTLYANFSDPEESDIGRDAPEGEEILGSGAAVEGSDTTRSRELDAWLYFAGLVLLVGEWGFSLQRRASRA